MAVTNVTEVGCAVDAVWNNWHEQRQSVLIKY